ncbi:MAG TPA: hypothetical protein VMC05_11080 [Xanthobacteraceae bacterium]|nr:hypothetical protein [Xanthobacteraceae bacterium]
MSTQSVTSRSGLLRENVLIEPRQVGSLARRAIGVLREWRRRMQSRHELALLSHLDRKDLGYPDRIAAELAKPFWRA